MFDQILSLKQRLFLSQLLRLPLLCRQTTNVATPGRRIVVVQCPLVCVLRQVRVDVLALRTADDAVEAGTGVLVVCLTVVAEFARGLALDWLAQALVDVGGC